MGKNKYNITTMGFTKTLFLFVLIISAFGCNDPVDDWSVDSQYMVMTEYINEYREFSEFGKMIEHTKLYSLLNTRGPFTLFLPTNEAINEMYEEMGVSSFSEIADTNFVYDFIHNHLIGTSIVTAEIGLGALRKTNTLGDYIVSDFVGTDIRLNKEAIITKRDVELSNGYIHVINKTIPIIEKSVYQTLKEMPSYSIFVKGLELTGLSDTLDMIDFDYADLEARNRYSVLAVADTTFNRYGITTPEELVDYFTDDESALTSIDNSFYQYMVYHCMRGTYFLSDLTTGTYPVISQENNISVIISTDYKLNPNDNGEYTGFNVPESNYPTKNGALHTIDDILEAVVPSPVSISWEVTDLLEITSGDWYMSEDYPTSFHKWVDGENAIQNIKFQGDYLQYYYIESNNNFTNHDCLNMLGYWWIEITTPKIMKGKYEVSGRISGGTFTVYVDGEKVGVLTPTGKGLNKTLEIGTHTWDTTREHTIKLVALSFSTLFWDDIQFEPVN